MTRSIESCEAVSDGEHVPTGLSKNDRAYGLPDRANGILSAVGIERVNGARQESTQIKRHTSGAPEVEAVLRLHDEGLRVEEVPVLMRERSAGESKLRGRKAVVLVLTVIGTLVTAGYLRQRKKRRG